MLVGVASAEVSYRALWFVNRFDHGDRRVMPLLSCQGGRPRQPGLRAA